MNNITIIGDMNIAHHNYGATAKELCAINRRLDTIMASQAELAQDLTRTREQLQKVLQEVSTRVAALEEALANAGQTTPEVDAALADLKQIAQVLDDLNPDSPPVP